MFALAVWSDGKHESKWCTIRLYSSSVMECFMAVIPSYHPVCSDPHPTGHRGAVSPAHCCRPKAAGCGRKIISVHNPVSSEAVGSVAELF